MLITPVYMLYTYLGQNVKEKMVYLSLWVYNIVFFIWKAKDLASYDMQLIKKQSCYKVLLGRRKKKLDFAINRNDC